MTTQVNDQTPREQYTATASQTIFPYNFLIYVKGDITVEQNGTALTVDTDYTVTGVENIAGGSVILTTGATVGDVITVYRTQGFDRETDYQSSGDFLASTVNDDFNRIILMLQQNRESLSRSLKYAIDDTIGSALLPSLANRAGKLLAFDASGNPTTAIAVSSQFSVELDVKEYGATGDGVTDDTAAIQACIDSADEYAVIRFPPGKYLVSDDLNLTTDHQLIVGRACKIIQTAANKRTLRLDEVFDVEITGFELTGLGTEDLNLSTSYNNVAGIYIGNSINVRVHHNYLNNHAGGGIRFETPLDTGTVCQDINISHNTVRGVGSDIINSGDQNFDVGIGAVSSRNYEDIIISDNDVSDHIIGIGVGTGITGTPVGGSGRISDNYVHDIPGQHGIYCNPVSSFSISNNTVRNTALDGIKVQIRDNSIFDGAAISDMHITNNVIIDAISNSINVIGDLTDDRSFDTTCSVSGNTVSNITDGVNGRGAYIGNFRGSITNNTFAEISGYGLRFIESSGIIDNNIFRDTSFNSIYATLLAGEELILTNNMFIDAAMNDTGGTPTVGTASEVRHYLDIRPESTAADLHCCGNTFKSIRAETADLDHTLSVAANINAWVGGNNNFTSKPIESLGTLKALSFGLEEVEAYSMSGAGAIPVVYPVVHITTTGANALTLADGADNQRMSLLMITDAGAGTLTPGNLGNGTTITFDDVGDSAELLFTNSAWHFMGGTATLA